MTPARFALAGLLLVAACNNLKPYDSGSNSNGSTSSSGDQTSDPTDATTTGGGGSTGGAATGVLPTSSGSTGGIGGECNLFLQDCPDGQKCSAYSDGSIFPNGTRCVPLSPNSVGPGEECVLDGMFGEGIDNCAKGSLCLDIESDGKATCVAYCTGSMDDPKCPDEAEDRCSFLFEPTVPLCFRRCDPLIQDCGNGEACVPNIAALGAPFFVCMPTVFPDGPGGYGDACLALSACDPGNLCIFAENLPKCPGVYCCSVWCDLTANEPCTQYDPTLKCVPWFEPGNETPGYENVGICGIMQ
jgi:hypothetical protein